VDHIDRIIEVRRRERPNVDPALFPSEAVAGTRSSRRAIRRPSKEDTMSVREILEAHPRPLIADAAVLARCLDECGACEATCTICADACAAEPGVGELVRCIRLCLDCADACAAAVRILGRQTDAHPPSQLNVLETCLAACRACADECELHAAHHRHCAISAAECRRCEEACEGLREALTTLR
jgi:hypothetical protein